MRLDFLRLILVFLGHLSQQSYLGQVRTELIVQVARNSSAFFFERFLLAHQCQLSL